MRRGSVIACAATCAVLYGGAAMAQGVRPAGAGPAGAGADGAVGAQVNDVWNGLVMRSGLEPPVGRPISIGIEGLTVEAGEGVAARRFQVGLDRIASPPRTLGESFERVRVISEHAWRARIRLERGDLVAAEPMLEQLASEIGEARGATPELVHRGLLVCRLARGVHTGALESYVRWRLASDGLASDSQSDAGLEAAIDSQTRLAPQLPPIWIDGPATQAFARSASRVAAADGSATAETLARLYEVAAKVACNEPVSGAWDPLAPGSPSTSAAVGDEGVGLVRDIVAARLGDEATRIKARNELLRRRVASIPAWQHAWILVGVGQSLVRETDREQRLRGVASLLEVAARYEDACPYLTGLAMADAAITLADMGDNAAALRIRSDLAARWPGHAAIDTPGLRSLADRPASGAPGAALAEPPTSKATSEPIGNSRESGTSVEAPSVEAPAQDPK